MDRAKSLPPLPLPSCAGFPLVSSEDTVCFIFFLSDQVEDIVVFQGAFFLRIYFSPKELAMDFYEDP